VVELTLLGTGTPIPDPRRAGPSQLVRVGDDRILIDCGTGAVRRLVEAGESPRDVHTVLITHMHSDHSIDLGHFLITRWIMFNERPLALVGPPGLREYVDNLLRLLDWDIKIRGFDTRLSDEARRIDVREVAPGEAVEGEHWRATPIHVDHYPVEHAFAWRLDAEGAALVVSGDTAPYEPLAEAAAGVDVLVHETWLKPKHEAARQHMTAEEAEAFIAKRNRYHTSTKDVGRIARLADPKVLLLSHLGPVNVDEVRADVARDFDRFVVGEDLLRYDVGRARPA
jgi:ribonuclease Z